MPPSELGRADGARATTAGDVPSMDAAGVSSSAGARAISAAYYALVLWIPIETLFVFDAGRNGDKEGITVSKLLGLFLFGMAMIEWRRCFQRIPAVFWMLAWYFVVFALSE